LSHSVYLLLYIVISVYLSIEKYRILLQVRLRNRWYIYIYFMRNVIMQWIRVFISKEA